MQLQDQMSAWTLIGNASTIGGPGFVPGWDHEIINSSLENGMQINWPANLMTIGPYQEPSTPFLSSLTYWDQGWVRTELFVCSERNLYQDPYKLVNYESGRIIANISFGTRTLIVVCGRRFFWFNPYIVQ